MRVFLFDTPVDILSRQETIDRAVTAMATRQRCQHVALNVAKLVNARSDAELDRDMRDSDIVGIDGMGIVFALRLFGHKVEERVAGVDLFDDLIAAAAERGFRPYLLGATQAVLNETMAVLSRRHPTLNFAGARNGYFKPEEEAGVVADIRASGADCLFIAMPTPRKERFMHAWRDQLNVPFLMGVGGTFDVVAGKVERAPDLYQKLGMEWLYRLMQEPRRMFWRYARTNTLFLALMLPGLLRHWIGGERRAA
jgi:N-acetylglucosaminyldiphosphoundecaprenol N-acetyl-beta-D-mannosaminyltransferase